jgi:hypothetical protein
MSSVASPQNKIQRNLFLVVVWLVPVTLTALPTRTADLEESAPMPPPPVRVSVQSPEVNVFQDAARLEERGFQEKDCRTGCTLLELTMAWNLDTTLVTFSDGERLFWISGLRVTLGYSSTDVFVAPRFQQGKCEYEAVLEHEKKHINADRALLEEYAGRIQAGLAVVRWPTYAEPVAVRSATEARESSRQQVSAVIEPLMAELQEKRRQAGQALDTAEGALQLRRICGSR